MKLKLPWQFCRCLCVCVSVGVHFSILYSTHSLGLASVSPRLWMLVVCGLDWGKAGGCLNSTVFRVPPLPEQHTNALMQIWERMNQTWEMHLHNLLTTHSHLNHYTISQVSAVNIQELTGKIPELFLIRRSNDGGKNDKGWLVSKAGKWFNHTFAWHVPMTTKKEQREQGNLLNMTSRMYLFSSCFTFHHY